MSFLCISNRLKKCFKKSDRMPRIKARELTDGPICSFGQALNTHCGPHLNSPTVDYELSSLLDCGADVTHHLQYVDALEKGDQVQHPSEVDLILNRAGQDIISRYNVQELSICPLHRLNLTTGYLPGHDCHYPLHSNTMEYRMKKKLCRVNWKLSMDIYRVYGLCVPIGDVLCSTCTKFHRRQYFGEEEEEEEKEPNADTLKPASALSSCDEDGDCSFGNILKDNRCGCEPNIYLHSRNTDRNNIKISECRKDMTEYLTRIECLGKLAWDAGCPTSELPTEIDLLLNRVGLDSSSADIDEMCVCPLHRINLTTMFCITKKCSHPKHEPTKKRNHEARLRVSWGLSKRLFSEFGVCVPIGEGVCSMCQKKYLGEPRIVNPVSRTAPGIPELNNLVPIEEADAFEIAELEGMSFLTDKPEEGSEILCSFGKLLEEKTVCGMCPWFNTKTSTAGSNENKCEPLESCNAPDIKCYLAGVGCLETNPYIGVQHPAEVDLILNRTGQNIVGYDNVKDLNICPMHRFNLTKGFVPKMTCHHPKHPEDLKDVTLTPKNCVKVTWSVSTAIFQKYDACVPIGQIICNSCYQQYYMMVQQNAVPNAVPASSVPNVSQNSSTPSQSSSADTANSTVNSTEPTQKKRKLENEESAPKAKIKAIDPSAEIKLALVDPTKDEALQQFSQLDPLVCSVGKISKSLACGANPLYTHTQGHHYELINLNECQNDVTKYLDSIGSLEPFWRTDPSKCPTEIELILNRLGESVMNIGEISEVTICPLHRLRLTTMYCVTKECQHPKHSGQKWDKIFQKVNKAMSKKILDEFNTFVCIGQGVCKGCTSKYLRETADLPDVPKNLPQAAPIILQPNVPKISASLNSTIQNICANITLNLPNMTPENQNKENSNQNVPSVNTSARSSTDVDTSIKSSIGANLGLNSANQNAQSSNNGNPSAQSSNQSAQNLKCANTSAQSSNSANASAQSSNSANASAQSSKSPNPSPNLSSKQKPGTPAQHQEHSNLNNKTKLNKDGHVKTDVSPNQKNESKMKIKLHNIPSSQRSPETKLESQNLPKSLSNKPHEIVKISKSDSSDSLKNSRSENVLEEGNAPKKLKMEHADKNHDTKHFDNQNFNNNAVPQHPVSTVQSTEHSTNETVSQSYISQDTTSQVSQAMHTLAHLSQPEVSQNITSHHVTNTHTSQNFMSQNPVNTQPTQNVVHSQANVQSSHTIIHSQTHAGNGENPQINPQPLQNTVYTPLKTPPAQNDVQHQVMSSQNTMQHPANPMSSQNTMHSQTNTITSQNTTQHQTNAQPSQNTLHPQTNTTDSQNPTQTYNQPPIVQPIPQQYPYPHENPQMPPHPTHPTPHYPTYMNNHAPYGPVPGQIPPQPPINSQYPMNPQQYNNPMYPYPNMNPPGVMNPPVPPPHFLNNHMNGPHPNYNPYPMMPPFGTPQPVPNQPIYPDPRASAPVKPTATFPDNTTPQQPENKKPKKEKPPKSKKQEEKIALQQQQVLTGERVPCTHCNKTFSSKSGFKRHYDMHHSDTPPQHPCPVCKKMYMRKDHLKRHKEVAHKGYVESMEQYE